MLRAGLSFTLLCLGLSSPLTARAAEPFSHRAAELLEVKVAELDLVGVSAAVARRGEIVFEGGAGLRDRERDLPATSEMVHRIASITKAMTATAVLQLVESGDIDLAAPVQRYLPGFPSHEKGTIEIHHLLTHTSGMRHYVGAENRPMEHYPSLAAALEVFEARPLVAEPGVRFLYSTYGYTVLGAVIEAVTGRTYGEHMREAVFAPAGMTRTRPEDRSRDEPQRSALYRRDGEGEIVPDLETDLSIKVPGGGLVSTAGDLVRFGIAFQDGRLVAPETIERMLVVPEAKWQRVPYAMGWMVWQDEVLGRVLHQDGGQSGTSTILEIYPERDVVVAVIGNVARTGREIDEIRRELVELLLAE
ncbi:MAG: serine hydrolase domain-containing protein [Thermoanaerobaculia bacterium]|nr:serine hydrolase domain-containing protein [Thermoanaerobaculia bacterium]